MRAWRAFLHLSLDLYKHRFLNLTSSRAAAALSAALSDSIALIKLCWFVDFPFAFAFSFGFAGPLTMAARRGAGGLRAA